VSVLEVCEVENNRCKLFLCVHIDDEWTLRSGSFLLLCNRAYDELTAGVVAVCSLCGAATGRRWDVIQNKGIDKATGRETMFSRNNTKNVDNVKTRIELILPFFNSQQKYC